ncbi:N-acetyltransferase [Marinicrinis lubricantis]|uniref:N-acetyltransferase n=1 Tax=Marinicrinis lubricantis TaxID=2086470 RepID=A0ABW1IUR3_9BACL
METQIGIQCRKAIDTDVDALYELIESYAEQGIMLPRSRESLIRQLDHFFVAVQDDKMIGCGSLFRLGQDLVEVRSLGINKEYKGNGIGSKLLELLETEARSQGIPKLMALTYEVRFFQKNGFQVVEKEVFPEKVWTDCVHCKKQHCCDEIAVLKMLD